MHKFEHESSKFEPKVKNFLNHDLDFQRSIFKDQTTSDKDERFLSRPVKDSTLFKSALSLIRIFSIPNVAGSVYF